MDYRIKCAIQHVFSAIPGGQRLNYLMQRYVQRSLPASDERLESYRRVSRKHLENYSAMASGRPRDVFEFGSGQSLAVPILLGLEGCRVMASDVRPLKSDHLVRDMLRRLGAPSLQALGVTHQAPYKAGEGAPAEHFDLIISNSVLEHVPEPELPALLGECRRILKPAGICSFWVDYQDHWSYFDKGLSPHNFLQFSDRIWPLYNPGLQYQNRLRHSDYIKAFESSGFEVLSVEPRLGEAPSMQIAEKFARYRANDLSILGAWFVLAKSPGACAMRTSVLN